MSDETSGIVLGRTDGVYRTKNDRLQFALDHWIGVADVLKQQRDQAEKERDALKARAEAAEREREAVYVQIECCADEIDILKHEREKWEKRARKLLRHRKVLRAERDALRKDNEVLHQEVQMQLMELGMKGIGDRVSQYLRADDECNKAVDRAMKAEAERYALRKDAARLDWLEKHGVRTDWCDPENPDSVWVIFSDNRKDWDAAGGSSNGETLREAIDAAMEATP